MSNSALGSALTIPKGALDRIKEADDRLAKLQSTASNAANSVKASFDAMNGSTKGFIASLDQIIAKLGTINASASNAGSGLGNLGQGLGSVSSGTSRAVQDLNNLINQMSKIGGNGASSVMEAVLAFRRLQEAAKGVSGQNIAELKAEIKDIDATLNNVDSKLTKTDQEALLKRKKSLQDELKMQQQVDEERVVSFQKALDRMASAQQSYEKKQQRSYAERSKSYQTSNYQKNTTYQGALDFSSTANTLNRQAKAIEYLKAARMSLSKADSDYKQKLEALNAAIKQHSKNLRDAGVSARSLGEQTSYMEGYLSRWAQRMMFAFSVDTIKGFVGQMAEVRGQFELSQRSLEAIIKNKSKADEIFNKTVQLAVKSPFQVKELIDYTRQLSAYRIESDKLYDTTKRLADVSAGLGVDMGRLILAYGQVKAAAYLRGSEVRQFTEAGINVYGELQQYFKEVKGEAYTTAQIVDMISQRKVSFEDIEAVFKRMTDRGGTFYNMQEIQADTLKGKISNLKDAYDIMLNEIGMSSEGFLKGAISGVTALMNNWEAVANVGKTLAGVLVLLYLQSLKTGVAMSQVFTTSMVTGARGNLKLLAMFLSGLRNAGQAALMFGRNLLSAITSNAWLIGIAVAIQAFMSFRQKVEEFNEAIAKSNKEYAENYREMVSIQQEYDSASGTNSIDAKRDALQRLLDLMKKSDFVIDIKIDGLSERELSAQFNGAIAQYKNFLETRRALEYSFAKDDSVKDDIDEYVEQYNEVISRTTDLGETLDLVSTKYAQLSDKAKEYYSLASKPRRDDESELQYLQRLQNALVNLSKELQKSGSLGNYGGVGIDIFSNLQGQLSYTSRQLDELKRKKDDLLRFDNESKTYQGALAPQLRQLMYSYRQAVKRGIASGMTDAQAKQQARVTIKTAIDKTFAAKEIDDLGRDLLYAPFGINVKVNEASIQNEVNWIDNYLERYFDSKKFNINVGVSFKGYGAMEKTIEHAEKLAKAARTASKFLSLFQKRKSTDLVDVTGDIRELFNGKISLVQKEITIGQIRKRAKEIMDGYTAAAKEFNIDPFESERKKASTPKRKRTTTPRQREIAKQERDIINERINLLKDMNDMYNKLLGTESKEAALVKTRRYYKEAAQNVGWKVSDIMPDDASVSKAIREQAAKYKKSLSKRGNALRIAADVEFNIEEKEKEKLRNDITRNIDAAFSSLDLYKNLRASGLSETQIKQSFGDLATSFEEVSEKINEEFGRYIDEGFKNTYGKDTEKWSKDVLNKYNEAMRDVSAFFLNPENGMDEYRDEYLEQSKKLDEQIKQDRVNTFTELTKAYKTALSDQLQLDIWYFSEKKKIYENVQDPRLQNEYLGNLEKQYKEKTDENKWKEFQNSDMYIAIFEDLDHTSTRVLEAMKTKLESLRSSLKNLTPEQLKQIASSMEKIESSLVERNPYKGLAKTFKDYIAFVKKRKQLEQDYLNSLSKEDQLDAQADSANRDVYLANEAYEAAKKKYGETSKEAVQAKLLLILKEAELDVLLRQLVAQKKITAEEADQLRKGLKLESKLEKQLHEIGSELSAGADAITGLFDALNDWGVNIEMSDEMTEFAGGLSKIASSLQSIDLTKPMTTVSGVIGVIGGLGKALGGIFGWGTKDKKLQKQIEEHQQHVEALQEAYNNLKDAIDNCYDITEMAQYNEEMIKNIQLQNASLKSMIKAEEAKKKTDDEKIEEYRKQIEENNKAIKEAEESLTEQLGGFGSKSNYKAAAEAFAEAWVDAYNEGSDALDALNDKFNDYIKNLIVKQATQRVVGKLIEPLLQEVDKAVSKGSDGANDGLELTKTELANIMNLANKIFPQVGDAMSKLLENMGWKGSGSSSSLSKLQQGIQSMTESTAQALESILNSMRYYVATQQADVRTIRNILEARLGNVVSQAVSGGASNQMIAIMEQQTGYLHEICDNWSSVMKTGHKQGGRGIKVFMS